VFPQPLTKPGPSPSPPLDNGVTAHPAVTAGGGYRYDQRSVFRDAFGTLLPTSSTRSRRQRTGTFACPASANPAHSISGGFQVYDAGTDVVLRARIRNFARPSV
jgi:hypothetical protein